MLTVQKLKNLFRPPILLSLYSPKMKMFNFEVEEKLDQYFHVKFDKESEFNSFEAEKISRDPLSDPLFLS